MSETAWAFLVVSSDKQGDTLEDQSTWAKLTAQANHWEIVRTFRGTSSGKAGARKLLEQLLTELRATAKSERPNRVLMTRLDRTGRGLALEPLVALAEIYRLGVIIHTREDGDNIIAKASDTIKPILRVLTGALENEARIDKARAKYEQRRRSGVFVGNMAPYGMKLQKGMLIIDSQRAKIVREVFDLRLQGLGYLAIGRRIAKKAPPKERKDGSLRDISWHRTLIRYMLSCKSYRGTIVKEDVWDRAQQIKNPDFKLHGKTKWPWPLRGAVRCAECGYALTTSASGNKNCRIRYYVCLSPHHEKTYYHRADRLEDQFTRLLDRLVAKPELIARYRRRPRESEKSLRSRLAELERLLERAERRKSKAWELTDDPAFNRAELADRLKSLGDEIDRLRNEVSIVTRQIAAHSGVVSIRADAKAVLSRCKGVWRRAGTERKQSIAQAVSRALGGLFVSKTGRIQRRNSVDVERKLYEQMREVNTLRDVQMAQRKADNQITKKFIESITE